MRKINITEASSCAPLCLLKYHNSVAIQLFKKLFIFHSIIIISLSAYTQKQSFDVVSFTVPKGWQQQQNEGGVQLSVTDKTGAYAIAIVTKAMASEGTADENFTADWDKLVKTTVPVNVAPTMQEPAKKKWLGYYFGYSRL